jgi:16S rRNA C1402 (ribose-2'-O) methylase RsmI
LLERAGVPAINSPGAVLVVVAGANNAGVSAVVETFGPRGGPPAVVRIPVEGT